MKRFEFWLGIVCSLAASVASAATATTPEFRLSLKEDAIRESAGEETLRYSPIWDGGSNETARVTLKQGEATLADGLLDEGDYSWSVTKPGTYVLTHTTYTNSTLAKTLTATFMVSGVPFPAGSVTATGYNGKFDGKGHGITVTTTDIENPSITYARAQSGPYVETNPLFTNVCSETVWYVVSADGYIPQTNSASVVITDGDIENPFDPDDPTKSVTPEALARANCVTNYDGDGHSIEVVSLLNPLIAANNPQVTYSLLQNGTYESQNPVFTNVVSTSVWYRIAADNFKPFTTNALLTISPRAITKATMAAIADQTYTGSAITPVPTVSDERTLIGAAEPTNIITSADYAVSYADNVNVGTAKIILTGTNNYEGVVTNTFNITAAPIPFDPTVGITATGYTNAYDGAAHGVSVTATGLKTIATVQYKGSATADWQNASPTYTDVCDTQVWWKVSAPNYQTVEGTIGLKITARPVTITSGTKTDFVYDGQPHEFSVLIKSENGFIEGEGIATSNWATVTTVDEGEVANTFDYSPMEGTKLSNYDIAVVTGKIAVVAAEIDPSVVDPVNPDPSDPYAPYSSYDVTVVYDGQGHTINTQALYAATLAGATPSFSFSLESNGVYQTTPFVYTNVGEYVCWYKIEAPNYRPFVHRAQLMITNCVGATWYVDETNGSNLNSGLSWTFAKKSIQAAIDVASAGDSIFVTNGVYGAIDASEVQVNIRSVEGPSVTVIDGEGVNQTAVLANTTASPQSTLTGFTLRNGFYNEAGAGVLCGYVYNCIVSNCTGYAAVHGCKAYNTLVVHNHLTKNGSLKWYGAAMHSSLYNCTVADNDGYAAVWDCGCYNSVILGELYIATASSGGVECFYNCCLSTMKAGSWTISSDRGNFVADPLFVNADAGDYRLSNGSPCIDAGNDAYVTIDCDLAGNQRIVGKSVDVGCNEYGFVHFSEGEVVVTGYGGKYDGEGHGIKVTAPEGSTIRYARSAEGPYGENPSFTNVCGSTTIWCEVTKAGYIPYTNSATVVISKRELTLTSGSGARTYNGIALTNWTFTVSGDDFVGDEGVTCTYSGTQTIVGSSKNTFDYALKSGTSADNYTISKVEGDLEVTASEIVNPFDPDDPTKPVSPEALAKANCVTNYDGDGHSIDVVSLLNPLIAANNPQVTYSLLQDGTYGSQNPVFTNVVSTSVWYRIAADNFKPFTTNALLTISPRAITKATMAAIADQTYTGSAITPVPTVSDERTLIGAAEPTNIITSADYEVSYADNINVGTAKIILAGTNNYEGVVTNTFNITAAPIPFDPTVGITATGYTNAYDGAAHGVSVTATGLKTTATVQYKGSATASWQDASPTYTDVCDTQVWWKVSAPNYQTVEGTIGLKITQAANEWTTTPAIEGWTYGETAKTPVGAAKFGTVAFAYDPTPVSDAGNYTMTASVAGTANYTGLSTDVSFTIAKKTIPGGGDEPGGGEVPPGGLSKYDVTVMYDGEEHTIDTNKIAEAFKTVVVGTFEMQYAVGNGTAWGSELPAWKDVVATSLWYKVTSPNYNDYTHQAKVTVTNRPVTVTSKDISKPFDGTPLKVTAEDITVAMGGGLIEAALPAGESFVYGDFGERTEVGTSPASFSVSAGPNTKLDNYDIHCVTGTITITEAGAVTVTVTGRVSSVTYDGSEKSVSGYDIVAISDPLYKATDFKFTGVAATNGTDAGTYPMGLKPSDFVNTNGNFSAVTFNVTDGSLMIAQAANEWTTTPAIEGWTYGETAKTPVGAAKFGMVAFTYDPTPVGDAGDYTMTASVAGTANYTALSKDVSFTIAKKTIPGGGDEPGGGEVPPSGLSKYDVTVMYDGEEHTIDTNKIAEAFKTVIVGAFEMQYAVGNGTAWGSELPVWKDVVATSLWYKVTSPNYEDFTHEVYLTITARDIAMATIAPIPDVEYADKPATPVPVVTDGTPSIIKTSDYDVSYLNNTQPGTATVTLTGKGNYTGTKSMDFVIVSGENDHVVFDAFGGAVNGESVVTQEVNATYGTLPVAVRPGYVLDGWYLGVTNGAPKAADNSPVLVAGDHTLFARWTYDPSVTDDPETIYKWEAIDANTVRILGFKNVNQILSTLVLPDRIGGLFVTEVGTSAFANSTCGATKLVLPMFCTTIADKAFINMPSLKDITFAETRDWRNPSSVALLSIGKYAFSGAKGLTSLSLGDAIGSLGDYAFLNARNLASVTILGKPTVGKQVFRSAGLDATGVTIHLDPALASDSAYMASLRSGMSSVTVKTDAIVKSLSLKSLSLSPSSVKLTVSAAIVKKWNGANPSALRVSYRASLADEPVTLTPTSAMQNSDGTVTLEVATPQGSSGFFQTILEK